MKRTTLVSAEGAEALAGLGAARHGSLKVFFSYAPCSGTTTAMLDEAQGLMGSGRDVLIAAAVPGSGRELPFDVDQVLKRRPDIVVLEDLAQPNPPGSRNRTRYQDAEELLRAGIDVYATLRVTDLQNEQGRAQVLGVEVPPEAVPDYMLYGAQQLEFVDIDPAELVARAKANGRAVPERVLNELRMLALRCVSEYAASAGLARDGACARDPKFVRSLVVAVVEPDASPGRVLLEAARLAAVSRAELACVSVRRERRPDSPRAAQDEAAFAALEEQVEAMDHDLVVLYGDDSAEVVRDYLRTQGAADVVVARRPLTLGRRLLMPFVPPFEDRVAAGLADVSVHLVADDGAAAALGTAARAAAPVRGFKWAHVLAAVLACLVAFAVARVLSGFGFGEATSYFVFLGAFVAVAVFTRSYVPAFVAVAVGSLLQDYFFIRSYLDFSIDHRASLLAFVAFAAVSAGAVAGVVRTGRIADAADRRERRTQALFDLNRSLLVAHGSAEAVDISLDAVERLFGRSVALYVRDPFAERTASPGAPAGERRGPAVRAVSGDLDAQAFDKLTEQSVAHWVFENREYAGSGTDTHSESEVYYVPLASGERTLGVLAVSERRALSLADRSFLDLVANQVTYALERQAYAAGHLADLHAMRAAEARGAFVDGVAASAASMAEVVHALSDALLGVPDEDRAWREALVRAISDESARGRLMVDRMQGALDSGVDPVCDVRAEVSAAVDEVREGLSGKVIDLEPGERLSPIVADAALVRTAVKLVLEASTSYVGRKGIVQVSVTSFPDRVSVVVADDRAGEAKAMRAAAFELVVGADGETELAYEEARARSLREVLLDRSAMTADQQKVLAALCRAMHLPEGVARSEADRDGALNRQRLMRFDRLEYGLYMAALIVRAHGGTIKQRYRLGGGAVVTLTLPREQACG